MNDTICYKNHIEHYKRDAEFQNYFETTPFERQNIRRRYEHFFSLIPKGDLRILEIGSGGGFALREINKSAYRYFPLDIPLSNLKEIKRRSASDIFPVSGDVFHLPVKSEGFDVVILSEVLEHLEDALKALKEIRRILKPGGELLISVPYKEKISYQICVHCNQPTPTHAHFHSFDEQKLKRLIHDAGLTSIRCLKISNKLATRLRIYIILQTMPFGVWNVIDRVFNYLIPKASHLMAVIKK